MKVAPSHVVFLIFGASHPSSHLSVVAHDGLVDVRDDLDALAEDEHDHDADKHQRHVQLLPLRLQRLRARPRHHLLL